MENAPERPLSRLDIRLFGTLRVCVGGQPVPALRTRSMEWLLALLALQAGEPLGRSRLAGTLWPESREEQALTNLRGDLLRLRRALGAESARIVADRLRVRLELPGAFVDVLEFDACVEAGDEPSLQRAVALYTAPLLSDCDGEWVLAERERRERACLAALERLAEASLSRGEAPEALDCWQRAAALDWTRGGAQRGVLRALEACGDALASLLAYRDFRNRLWEEMGEEPDPETTALYREIQARVRAPAAATVRSNRPEEGIRDSPSVIRGESTDRLDPQPSIENRKSKIENPKSPLPTPLTTLIGRESETASVAQAVRANRLVTLVGAGGIGKTRLSIQVATDLAPEFPDGAAFIALAGLLDGSQLVAHVASALRADDAPSETGALDMASLAAVLAGRRELVVLDNCEHLAEHAALLARDLLERCVPTGDGDGQPRARG